MRELCTELNINFSALETIVALLECQKVCARWGPRVTTQEQKEYCMHISQALLNQYEAEGGSFLNLIITDDKT